jgi:hypothetical protein
VREGLSANKIGLVLREQGLGIRRQTLLQLTGAERAIWTHGQSLKFLPFGATPRLATLPEALSKIRRAYSFTVALTGRSELTGQRLVQHVTISTDRGMTRGELEDLAVEMGIEGKRRYGLELESAQLVGGLRSGELGVL